jgi:hypothetical protein
MKDKIRIKQHVNKLVGHGICDFIGDAISIQSTDSMVLFQNKRAKDMIVYSIDEKDEVVYIHRVKTHHQPVKYNISIGNG